MLDSQTTLILAAMLFLILPVVVWLALRPAPDPAVTWWCSGGLLAGLGIVLLGLRPWLPLPLSYHLANTCLLGSMVLWSQSLRCSLDRPWARHAVVLGLLSCAAFYSMLYAFSSPWLRGVLVRLALGGLAMQTAYWAWSLFRLSRSGNAAAIALNFAVLGLMLVGQALLTASDVAIPNPFSNTWDASLLALTALLTAMISHFCYVGMVLDRAAAVQIQTQLAQQSAQQTRLLDLELSRMERRRRMTILSGSLAHELNQPLTVALVNAQLAERHWQAEGQVSTGFLELLKAVQSSIDRTVRILQRLRDGGEKGWPGRRLLDLQEVLDQSLPLLKDDLRRLGVECVIQRSAQPLVCEGDEVALSQVMVNVLRNALQAMTEVSERRLEIVCRRVDGQVQLQVRDTGCGLSAELSQRWGEPLLTTKPDGLGLGLAISRDIVARHGGELSLRNLPEGGVEALLSLPLQKESA